MRACINNQQIRHHNKCVILELLYRQKRANKSTLLAGANFDSGGQ